MVRVNCILTNKHKTNEKILLLVAAITMLCSCSTAKTYRGYTLSEKNITAEQKYTYTVENYSAKRFIAKP